MSTQTFVLTGAETLTITTPKPCVVELTTSPTADLHATKTEDTIVSIREDRDRWRSRAQNLEVELSQYQQYDETYD